LWRDRRRRVLGALSGDRLSFSPDGRQWASQTVEAATGLGRGWDVGAVVSSRDRSLIVAVKTTTHELAPTQEVRIFVSSPR
jgi:hypothetical protein